MLWTHPGHIHVLLLLLVGQIFPAALTQVWMCFVITQKSQGPLADLITRSEVQLRVLQDQHSMRTWLCLVSVANQIFGKLKLSENPDLPRGQLCI